MKKYAIVKDGKVVEIRMLDNPAYDKTIVFPVIESEMPVYDKDNERVEETYTVNKDSVSLLHIVQPLTKQEKDERVAMKEKSPFFILEKAIRFLANNDSKNCLNMLEKLK